MEDGIPEGLRPPVELALAKAVPAVPAEGALPGGCLYEPKWDGYLHWTSSRAYSLGMPQSGDVVSAGLRPPLEVALAKATKGLPTASALPGVMLFEPKVDGYRVIIFRDDDGSTLWSRQRKELTRISVRLQHDPGNFSHVKGQLIVRDRSRHLSPS